MATEYEATRLIKSDNRLKHIPIIALTASPPKEKKSDMKKYGFEDYLRKPISRVSLFQKLSRFLKYSAPGKPAKKPPEELRTEDLSKFPNLIEKLEKELMPLWTDLRTIQPVRVVREFGKHVKALGYLFNMEIVKEFGNDLLLYIGDFDIENMRNRLSGFPELVEKLKSAGNYRQPGINISARISFPSLTKICSRHEDMSVIRDMKASCILSTRTKVFQYSKTFRVLETLKVYAWIIPENICPGT